MALNALQEELGKNLRKFGEVNPRRPLNEDDDDGGSGLPAPEHPLLFESPMFSGMPPNEQQVPGQSQDPDVQKQVAENQLELQSKLEKKLGKDSAPTFNPSARPM